MKKLSLFAFIMIMIMAACNKEDDNISTQSDSGDKDAYALTVRPFDASGEFDSKMADASCPSSTTLSNHGNGGSIAIGEFTVRGQQCWGNCDPEDLLSSSISDGRLMLTDQEGNRIFIAYTDGCHEKGLNCYSQSGCQVYTGQYTITGGTGKYNHVSGEGTLTITQEIIDPVNLTVPELNSVAALGVSSFEMSGSLSFPEFPDRNEYDL